MHLSHSQSKISTGKLHELGGMAAGCLCRGIVIEPLWLAAFQYVKHKGYENTTRHTEISTQQLCKECLILAKGKSLKFKPMVLQGSGDSVDVI